MSTEIISYISDVVVGLSAAGAIAIAYKALNTWRNEMKGRDEYELARRIMRSCYQVRDVFWQTRNPMSRMSAEMAMTREGLNEHAVEKFQTRWASMNEAMPEFEVALLESEILWGKDLVQLRIKMRMVVGELQMAIEDHFEDIRKNGEGMTADERKKLRKQLYAVPTSDDSLSNKMGDVLLDFENFCRPKLKR